jgi:hypothetical protein
MFVLPAKLVQLYWLGKLTCLLARPWQSLFIPHLLQAAIAGLRTIFLSPTTMNFSDANLFLANLLYP